MPEEAMTGDGNVTEAILAKLSADEAGHGDAGEGDKGDAKALETPEKSDTAESDDGKPEQDAASEDDESEAEPDADSEEESETEPGETVEVNGERITLDELKRGYLRGKDYTQKTQALAPERKAIETERQQTKEFLNQVQSFVQMVDPLREFRGVDWDKLSVEDPDGYTRLQHRYNRTVAEMKNISAANQHATQQAIGTYAKGQQDAMIAAVPDWSDDKKQPAMLKEMGDAMVAVGFSADDVRATLDHRILLLARDAAYGQKMRAAEKTVKDKTVKKAPATLAPKGGKGEPGKAPREKQALRRNALHAKSDRDKAEALFRQL